LATGIPVETHAGRMTSLRCRSEECGGRQNRCCVPRCVHALILKQARSENRS
jgi:hypothetical protein